MWLMLVVLLTTKGGVATTTLGYFENKKDCDVAAMKVRGMNTVLPNIHFDGQKVTTTCIKVGDGGNINYE